MSLTKRIVEYNNEMYNCARKILMEMGVIKKCFCGKIYYETYKLDRKDIYAIATSWLKNKYGEQPEYNTFHNQIDLVLTEAQDGNNCDCNLEEQ